jgi:hypothetical protein
MQKHQQRNLIAEWPRRLKPRLSGCTFPFFFLREALLAIV